MKSMPYIFPYNYDLVKEYKKIHRTQIANQFKLASSAQEE